MPNKAFLIGLHLPSMPIPLVLKKKREAARLHLCSLLPCCGRTVRCREHEEANRSCECRMTRGCIMPCSHGRCWQGRSRCRPESWKYERGQGRNRSVTGIFILLIARAAVGRPPRTPVTKTAGLFSYAMRKRQSNVATRALFSLRMAAKDASSAAATVAFILSRPERISLVPCYSFGQPATCGWCYDVKLKLHFRYQCSEAKLRLDCFGCLWYLTLWSGSLPVSN